MDEAAFLRRTKAFALGVLKLSEVIPNSEQGRILGRQLLRSGTSVGANYRAVCRAKSKVDMIHKLKIVEEELDESLFWMELLVEGGVVRSESIGTLPREANELLSMVVASQKTLASSLGSAPIENRKSKIENIK